ncbi:MAG: GlsB/YeaQ/YmgE family stress response membrane protein [Bacteroidota bacterium]
MFYLLIWGLIGLAAGTIAKMVTPQNEKGGWVSSIVIGIVGSMVGGFIARFVGLGGLGSNTLGDLIIATGGAILVLFVYHKYFADKWKLPI